MSTDHILHPDVATDAATAGAGHPATWSQLAIENQQGGKGPNVPAPGQDKALSPGSTVVPPADIPAGTGKGTAAPIDTINGTGKGTAMSPLDAGSPAGPTNKSQAADGGWDEIVMPNGGGDGRHPYDPYIKHHSGTESNPHVSRPGSGQIGQAPMDPSADPRADNTFSGANQGKRFDATPPQRPDTGKIGEAPHDPLKPVVVDNPFGGVTRKTINDRLEQMRKDAETMDLAPLMNKIDIYKN